MHGILHILIPSLCIYFIMQKLFLKTTLFYIIVFLYSMYFKVALMIGMETRQR